MSRPVRIGWTRGDASEALRSREWLVTNGLGGYASGTVGGVPTRRFHGPLIAALAAPHGRVVLLNDVTEDADVDGIRFDLGREETLAELRFELGLPVWQSEHRGTRIEKRLLMPRGQNTTFLHYRVASAQAPVTLRLRPWFHMRPHEGVLSEPAVHAYTLRSLGHCCEVESGTELGSIRLAIAGAESRLVLDGGRTRTVEFAIEKERGYDSQEQLWSPGWYEVVLNQGEEAALIASVEPWERLGALSPAEARTAEEERRERLLASSAPSLREGEGAELVLAADQFIISPRSRHADTVRAQASGYQASTVIAGYHWFTDWGRDTMISLEGLTLTTGRRADAESILRTFARHVKDGLIPNLFPEGESEGLYHTADATLWFFHAVHRYVEVTGDWAMIKHLLPTFEDIVEHHLRGTRFGIRVDPDDGLLTQGADGYQLTWMDAKVGDWVVTPRRGKAVEINALYYNALCLLEGWLRKEGRGDAAATIGGHASRAYAAFNARFWRAQAGCLFDVVDGPAGDDASIRPNQVLSISLHHPVLDPARWSAVIDVVQKNLVTPVGLRSLAPGQPDYKPRYDGDLRARDAAYHQGTVWAWLIGPFFDAYRKTRPDDREARSRIFAGLGPHLGEACIGSISEIFDAESPYMPRGCIAQAWSVAEALRVLAA
jgi:predicted glycogen debranching enzyme